MLLGPGRARRQDLSPGDRVTPLGGCPNFRHMGGYPTHDGRTTRAALLFRTGWLQLRAENEVERFRAYRIRQVFDFRNEAERLRQPLALPEPDDASTSGLAIDHGSMTGYLQALSGGSSSASGTRLAMTTMYREMIRNGAQQFAALLTAAAQADGPLMVACALGKDRTGVACALLLAALGVSKSDIFSDYLISAEAYRDHGERLYESFNFADRGIPFEVVRDVLTVHPEYLEAVWREMEAECGSADRFIRQGLHLADEARARLRDQYTSG